MPTLQYKVKGKKQQKIKADVIELVWDNKGLHISTRPLGGVLGAPVLVRPAKLEWFKMETGSK